MTSDLAEDRSRRFTEDISRQMRIPDRLGFSEQQLQQSHFGPGFAAAVMSVPDKILATGELASPAFSSFSATAAGGPGGHSFTTVMETPPATISLDRVRFPDFDVSDEEPVRLSEDGAETMSEGNSKRSRSGSNSRATVGRVVGQTDSSSSSSGSSSAAVAGLQARLVNLQGRLDALEAENRQRRQLEMLLYPAIGVFLLLRVARWLFSGNSQ